MNSAKLPHIVIGIDPGLSGGLSLSILRNDMKFDDVRVVCMPCRQHFTGKGFEVNPLGIVKTVSDFVNNYRGLQVSVFIERVGNMPRKRNGVAVTQGATSMFNFGDGFGILRGSLETFFRDSPATIHYVWPQAWQKLVFTGISGNSSKEKAVIFAEKHFPDVCLKKTKRCKKAHSGLADALSIMFYGGSVVCRGND